MTWGPRADFLKTVEEETGQTPAALQNRPVLTMAQLFYKGIFDEVSNSRSWTQDGQALGIPTSEILAYFEMFGIWDLEIRETALRMIRAMDAGFRKVMQDQADQRRANK